MNEEHAKRNQVDQLLGRFKQTGIVNPAEQVWTPAPTAGDHARALTQEIVDERNDELPQADETSRSLWNTKPA